MYRSLIVALPVSLLLACSVHSSSEDGAASTSEITSTSDFGTLESSLSLRHDDDRIREESTVKAGPCYQRMQSGTKEWNMRRYTTGAAFFYVDEAGDPGDTVECVDIDVPGIGGSVKETVALSGLSLDMALRFGLGRVKATAAGTDPTGGGTETLAFNNATIEIATIPARLNHDFTDNVPSYEGSFRGLVRSVNAPFVPEAHPPLGPHQFVPAPAKLMPAFANLAWRYSKDNGGTSLANDPIGRFVFIDDRSIGDFDAWRYVVHFEKMYVDYTVTTEGTSPTEILELWPNDGKYVVARCTRTTDQHDFQCWEHFSGKTWEVVLGHD